MFVAILLLIAGTLNLIYGLGAIGNAQFFISGPRLYVFANLHTWGWITVILGLVLLTAGLSLLGGKAYGRVIAIIGASLGALEALLSVGGTNPFWSLGMFAICLWVLHGLVVLGDPETVS
jgi:hypothetical protein